MTKKMPDQAVDRRGFLKSVGGASVAAAAVAGAVAPAAAQAVETDADRKKARYRESDHIKAYYRTNRY